MDRRKEAAHIRIYTYFQTCRSINLNDVLQLPESSRNHHVTSTGYVT